MNLPFSNPSGRHDGPGSGYDARPVVAFRQKDQTAWWFSAGAVVAAIMLFTALEARRRGSEKVGERSAATAYAAPEAIPDLVMPVPQVDPAPAPSPPANWPLPADRRQNVPAFATPQQGAATHNSYPPPSYADATAYQAQPAPPPLMVSGQDAMAAPDASALDSAPGSAGPGSARDRRIVAGRLENPATTVVQGTLINAVLETALDSTRPGPTRAVVTRDIFGFDGTRLLIPRGTRLYGTYDANIAQGQKRAAIRWARLLRPDGVSVALDSPAADPLGRAGVEGRVNSHFIQRLGNALLGTTANIGSALVTRSIASSSPVVVAVPGATQTATQTVVPGSAQIAPTLTVRQGVRITVFVQHDLDFTSVDEVP